MENENENFDQLRRLLALKKHEAPPPGYFNKLPGEIISRLRAGQHAGAAVPSSQEDGTPWFAGLIQKLMGRPAFASAFGASVCGLLLAGILLADKPDASPAMAEIGGSQPVGAMVPAAPEVAVGMEGLSQPLLMAATNTSGVPPLNLFDLYKPGQALPASAPGGR